MFTKSRSFFVLIGLTLLCFLVGANIKNIFQDPFLWGGYQSIFEATLLLLLSCLASNLFLLFFSEETFKLWLKRIVSWFLPVSMFLIWARGSGGSIIDPSQTGYAIFFGCVLFAVTVVFALVQKFYYKR